MPLSLAPRPTFTFDEFELQLGARQLMRDGRRIALGSKAFELLTCLVLNAGQVVSKEKLLKAVWSGSFVEESNLTQQIFALRKALGDRADLIATVPGRGYQFAGAVHESVLERPAPRPEMAGPLHEVVIQTVRERSHMVIEESERLLPVTQPGLPAPHGGRSLWGYALAAIVVAALSALAWMRLQPRSPETIHTILVSDFVNTTGDEAFDRTLKRALEIELGQSPSLSVMGGGEAVGLLQSMGQKSDVPLAGELARELCVRGNRQMLLAGGIARMGAEYLLTIEADDCGTGKRLASAKAQASNKEGVLSALDSLADRMRSQLGESSKSIESYQVPITLATTPSLEALKLYSIGQAMDAQGKDEASSIVFYQKATGLDPKFAMAWGAMANEYYNLNEYDLAAQTYRKAVDLSDRVSLHERLLIEAHYYGESLNDSLRAAKAYELWAATFPRDWAPVVNLCNLYNAIGMYQTALPPCREGLKRQPARAVSYSVLTRALKDANQLAEAKSIGDLAIQRKIDSTGLHSSLYEIAVVEHDPAAIAREIQWATDHSDSWYRWEFPFQQAGTAGSQGRMLEAETLFRQSVEAAVHENLTESARDILLGEAAVEAELGMSAAARATLSRIPADLTQSVEAAEVRVALGDVASTERFLAAQQAAAQPDTKLQFVHLPAIRARLALLRGRPGEAVQALEIATPYELCSYVVPSLRGEAYLKLGKPAEAIAEYRKVLTNPGVDAASPLYPLAHLGLARGYAAAGDLPASRAEYQQFLAAWKDADPGLAPLRAAQAELSRLPR